MRVAGRAPKRIAFSGVRRAQAAGFLSLGLAFFLLYLGLRSAAFPGDGVVFAGAIRSAISGARGTPSVLYHPHHILYNPLCLAVLSLGGADAADPFAILYGMAAVSAACGAIAMAALGAAVARGGGSLFAGLAAAATLGASRGMWIWATRSEVYSLSAALVALALVAVATTPVRRLGHALAGAAAGAAVLGHITNVLMLPGLLAATTWSAADGSLDATQRRTRRRSAVLAFLAAAAGVVGAGYLAGAAAAGVSSPRGFLSWFAPRYNIESVLTFSPRNLFADLSAMSFSFSVPAQHLPIPWLPSRLSSARPAIQLLYSLLASAVWLARAIVACLFFGMLVAVARRARRPEAGGLSTVVNPAPLMIACAGGFVPLGIFFTFWDAGNEEFWLVPFMLLCGLLGCGLAALQRRTSAPARSLGVLLGAGLLPVALLAANIPGAVLTELFPEQNEDLAYCRLAERAGRSGDAVLLSGVGERRALMFYLPYFSRRQALVAAWTFLDPRGTEQGIFHLGESLASAAAVDAGPWLLSEWDAPGARRELAERAGPHLSGFEALVQSYRRVEIARDEKRRTLWRLEPLKPISGLPGQPR